ncbi:MAG: hypothetical protein ACAH17_03705 [Candidatus Paceibacterota bacterium]
MTTEAKDWVSTVLHVLSKTEYRESLNELRSTFNPRTQAYAFQIKAYIPKEIYDTKDGKLSRRAFDVSNFEKSILDVFCLEKYPNNLQTDDCVVKSCHSTKLPSPDGQWRIDITIRIVKN